MLKNRYLALIPARGGSKRLPGKNIRPLAGKKLIQYTIEAALKSKVMWKVVVSTEDEEIARISVDAGAEVPFKRPASLSGDGSTTLSVVKHALDFFMEKGENIDAVVILQPTSPLRTAEDIAAAARLYEVSHADSVVSVCKAPIKQNTLASIVSEESYLRLAMPNTEVKGENLLVNGAIYILNVSHIHKNGTMYGRKVVGYPMPHSRSIDIDTLDDWSVAEALLSGGA